MDRWPKIELMALAHPALLLLDFGLDQRDQIDWGNFQLLLPTGELDEDFPIFQADR